MGHKLENDGDLVCKDKNGGVEKQCHIRRRIITLSESLSKVRVVDTNSIRQEETATKTRSKVANSDMGKEEEGEYK